MHEIKKALRTIWRFSTFRGTRDELVDSSIYICLVGIPLTWIIGYGRWWDDPRDLGVIIQSGIGSVVYVFLLGTLIWILSLPFKLGLRNFDYIAFVTCCAPPALVYAIPIERMTDLQTASSYNMLALFLVSSYRILLLAWFFRKIAEAEILETTVLTILPIALIAFSLTVLEVGAQVIDIMGGFRGEALATTAAERAVSQLGCISMLFGPLFILMWIGLWANRVFYDDMEKRKARRQKKSDESKSD